MDSQTTWLDALRARIKKILKSSSVGRCVYPYIQKVWKSYSIPLRRRRLHKYGYDVLDLVNRLMKENNIPYYCDAGTLLGFIRDGRFISHDDDIDMCIMPNTVSLAKVLKVFMDAGFGFIHGFDYKGRFLEFSVMAPQRIPIDVFLHETCEEDPKFLNEIFLRWFPDREYPNERSNTGLLFRFRGPDGLKNIIIHGVEVSVPSNAEEVLDSEYGPWRRPDPNFKSDQIAHVEIPGFVDRIDLEESLEHV